MPGRSAPPTSRKKSSPPGRRRSAKRTVARRTPRVLIIECDPATLATQSITVAQELATVMGTFADSVLTVLVRGTSDRELLEQLAAAKHEYESFDTIVIVGHSNVRGLRLFRGPLVPWTAVATWLRLLAPRRLVLVACEAGRWLPCLALFDGVPTLKEIFGSPVVTTAAQAAAVKLLVPFLAGGGRLDDDDQLRLLQFANFCVTGGVIFRQTRDEFEDSNSADGILWTAFEELLRSIVPSIRASIRR